MLNPETFNMIAHIKGLLIEKSPTEVVLEVNGIGYSINISLNTFSKLGNEKNIKLFTHQIIKEDSCYKSIFKKLLLQIRKLNRS